MFGSNTASAVAAFFSPNNEVESGALQTGNCVEKVLKEFICRDLLTLSNTE